MDWTIKNNQLSKNFIFSDFSAALDFVNLVGVLAERQDHHPDILLHDYNQVRLSISTHDSQQITDRDYHLALLIDKLG